LCQRRPAVTSFDVGATVLSVCGVCDGRLLRDQEALLEAVEDACGEDEGE
jgi:hypothetical protein